MPNKIITMPLSLCFLLLIQSSGYALEIVNVSKSTIIFSDNFESGVIGEATASEDPQVGTWIWNEVAINEIMGQGDSEEMAAAEGSHYLKVARMPDRVKLTAIGDPDAAAASEEGDTIEIRFSFYHESGYASIYPRSGDGDSAQITFFPGAEVRIYGGGAVG